MSLSGIVSSVTSKVESALGVGQGSSTTATSNSLPFGVATTAAGAQIAQGGGAAGGPSGAKSLITKMAIGGVLGAGLGFGASFLTLPIIGQVAAPIAAAVGGAIGALGGLALHFISRRKQNLAMQAQAQAAQQGAMVPTPMPAGGATLRAGARGAAAKKLQVDLRTLGLYTGKLNGAFDGATSQAVRKYEVMKGVMPTGQGSPDVRAAVAQDAALSKQYA